MIGSMPDRHAVLAPSAAHRWIECPASIKACEGIEDAGSRFAEEGTLAHEWAELEELLGMDGGLDGARTLSDTVEEEGFDAQAMEQHAIWAAAVNALADTLDNPEIYTETTFDTGIDECRGTADAVILSRGRIDVWDFKYGTGVVVNPENNPQMMLYGLGALNEYSLLDMFETVVLHIYQPRAGATATARGRPRQPGSKSGATRW